MKKKIFIGLGFVIGVVAGLRYYLIIKPVDYPINQDPHWNSGQVLHILPTVNHERFLVKVSFKEPLTGAPLLYVGRDAKTRGVRTDTEGRFWMFNVPGLSPDTEYDLVLKTEDGRGLCDSWPLKTFPAPDADPDHVRLLIYT
jgi:hypothetical protein